MKFILLVPACLHCVFAYDRDWLADFSWARGHREVFISIGCRLPTQKKNLSTQKNNLSTHQKIN
jgi:hypothetical protein